jgi:hypothetical protein
MLAIGQVQLYFRTAVDSYEEIKVGFPWHYYSFSRDENHFHGANVNNLLVDYFVTLIVVTSAYVLVRTVKRRL